MRENRVSLIRWRDPAVETPDDWQGCLLSFPETVECARYVPEGVETRVPFFGEYYTYWGPGWVLAFPDSFLELEAGQLWAPMPTADENGAAMEDS